MAAADHITQVTGGTATGGPPTRGLARRTGTVVVTGGCRAGVVTVAGVACADYGRVIGVVYVDLLVDVLGINIAGGIVGRAGMTVGTTVDARGTKVLIVAT